MRRNILLVLVFVGIQLIYPAATSQDRALKNFDEQIRWELFGEKPTFSDCLTINTITPRKLSNEIAPTKRATWTVTVLKEEMTNGQLLDIQHCMGVLINHKVVLSAAHCVFNKTLTQLKVRAGEFYSKHHTVPKCFQESHIEKVFIHDLYNLTHPQHDIALLLLEKSIKTSACVKIACLPPIHGNPETDNIACYTNGWISTEWRTSRLPFTNGSKLRQFKMHISPFSKCENVMRHNSFGPEFELSNSYICAQGHSGRELLQASGGAPLFCKICNLKEIIVIGISSWGFNTTFLPDAFTSIDKEKYWIQRTLQGSNIMYPNCRMP